MGFINTLSNFNTSMELWVARKDRRRALSRSTEEDFKTGYRRGYQDGFRAAVDQPDKERTGGTA